MFYRTDGTNLKALSLDDVMGTGYEASLVGSDASPRAYFTLVPFVRRAVRLRANAVSSVPVRLMRKGADVSPRPEWAGLMRGLGTLIWRTEAALCLSPHGAYWKKTTNKIGANPTPEWLLPHYVWPHITAEQGLSALRYTRPWGVVGAGGVEMLPVDQVVRFWYPSLDRANWPGTPPGVTVGFAASVLQNQDQFLAGYFKRGAIKATLLQVPADAKPADRDRLTAWWRSMLAGVSNAWKAVVVPHSVTPQVIGDGLKEMNNEGLTRQARQDVAAAFDIPETMLMQGAANFATAQSDRISFYEETIFPELGLILDALNTQWLEPAYGATLEALPEQTQARQDAQLTQAEAITSLVGQPVLTVNEGRSWLGLDPLDSGDDAPMEAPDEARASTEAAAFDAAEDAEESDEPLKALPTRMQRQSERRALLDAHHAQRTALVQRHADERTALRQRHTSDRQSATTAKERLRLTHRQRLDLRTLTHRQQGELATMRTLHGDEQERMRQRHAAARSDERRAYYAGLLDAEEWGDAAWDAEIAAWEETEDAYDLIGDPDVIERILHDETTVKKASRRGSSWGGGGMGGTRRPWNADHHPRGPNGRFIATAGGTQRKAERTTLQQRLAGERTALQQRHAAERATVTRDSITAIRQRHADERNALRQQHREQREQLSARHAVERDAEATMSTHERALQTSVVTARTRHAEALANVATANDLLTQAQADAANAPRGKKKQAQAFAAEVEKLRDRAVERAASAKTALSDAENAALSARVKAPDDDPDGLFSRHELELLERRRQTFDQEFERRQLDAQQRREQRTEALLRELEQTTPTTVAPVITERTSNRVVSTTAGATLRDERINTATKRYTHPQRGWNDAATEKQLSYLRMLVQRNHKNCAPGGLGEAISNELQSPSLRLTKWEASQFIDAMQQARPYTRLADAAKAHATAKATDISYDKESPGAALFALVGIRKRLAQSLDATLDWTDDEIVSVAQSLGWED